MFFYEITRTTDKDRAAKLKDVLDGQSFFNFRIGICPAGGEFSVVAESAIGGREQEAKDMLLFLLAEEVMDLRSQKEVTR